MQYVNLHTHKNKGQNEIKIINLIAGSDDYENLSDESFYSAGIHPWYTENLENNIELLEKVSTLSNLIAIGECGFDPKSSLNNKEQEQLFVFHAQLAEKHQKPLIIHCVKSYNELIRIKKVLKPAMPWVIHGFSANQQTLTQCLNQGLYYSVGKQLMNSKSTLMSIIHYIPVNRLFFETDDSDYQIEDLYGQYAQITGQNTDELRDLIYTNFVHLFLNHKE